MSSPKTRRKICRRVKLKDLPMSVKGKTTKQSISTIVSYLLRKARELTIKKYNRSNKRCKISFSENLEQLKFLLLTKKSSKKNLETLQHFLRDSNIVNKLPSVIPKMPSKREPLFAESTNKLRILKRT